MDFHHLIADRSIRQLSGLTAFSALPDAPVLADRPTRLDRLAAAWRRRPTVVRAPQALRPAPAPGVVAPRVTADAADHCRMVA